MPNEQLPISEQQPPPVEFQTPPPLETKPSVIKRYQKAFWTILVTAAVLMAGLIVYLLYFRVAPQQGAHDGDARVSVVAPAESPSGSDVAYQVQLENLTDSALTSVIMEVFYPHGFTYANSTISPSAEGADIPADGRQFKFANLIGRQKKKITIVGRLEGSIAEVEPVSVKVSYIPENFRSTFETSAQAQTVILAPDISLTIHTPSQAVSGQKLVYDIAVSNVGARNLGDLVLKFTYPQKFNFASATPVAQHPDAQNAQWAIPSLNVGESTSFSLTGQNTDTPGTASLAQAELFSRDSNGDLVSAGRSFAFTQMLTAPLSLSQRVVAGSADVLAVPTELQYEVTYVNQGQTAIHNAVIAVVFETPNFSAFDIRSEDGQVKDNSLVWIPAARPDLLVVQPGARGVLKFRVGLTNKLVTSLQKNPLLKTRVQFYSDEIGDPVSGNTLEYKVSSQLSITAAARAISGPNPPVAGQATVYQIDLTVNNTVNDISSATFTATIPGASSSVATDSISPSDEQANVSVASASGLLSWRMGDVFAFSGSFHKARTLRFNLSYVPTSGSGDTYSAKVLLRDLNVSGTDDFTSKTVQAQKLEFLVGQ